jgi:hypothetical protein
MHRGFSVGISMYPDTAEGKEQFLRTFEGLGDFAMPPFLRAKVERDCEVALAESEVGRRLVEAGNLDAYCVELFRLYNERELQLEEEENARMDAEEQEKFMDYIYSLEPAEFVASIRQVDGLWAAMTVLDSAELGDSEAEELKSEILSLARMLPISRY